MKITRRQAREALKTIPMESIMGANKLTARQKSFARKIAEGQTKAQAYRETYSYTPTTILTSPYALARDPRIQAEIEAYKLAIESARWRTPEHLRELVIHSLVQATLDPSTPASVRVSAIRALGNVTEVSAFTQRHSVAVTGSDDARSRILEVLRESVHEAVDVEGLLGELTSEPPGEPSQSPGETTHPTPTPQDEQSDPHDL